MANAQCRTLRSLAPCLRAAREKHRFAAGKKHRNGKKHVWQQEKNALQREKAVSAAGKIQSSRKNTLQQHKSTFAAEKIHFGGSKPSEAGKNPSEARKKPAMAGKKPAAEKVQLCNPKSCRNGKNTFPQREKAAAPLDVIVPSPKGLTPEVEARLRCVHWIGPLIIVSCDYGTSTRTFMLSWRRLPSRCNIATCLCPGRLIMGSS